GGREGRPEPHGDSGLPAEGTMTAAEIAMALCSRPQRLPSGGFLISCPVPSHGKGRGDRSPSLHISDGASRLLVHCFGGCDARDVLDDLRRRGLLDDAVGQPTASSRNRNLTVGQPTIKAGDANAYRREQHRKAACLWSQRQPIIGTIAETYLRSRGI